MGRANLFTVGLNQKSSPILYAPYKKPPQIFTDVRHWVNHVCCCAAWLTNVEEMQA